MYLQSKSSSQQLRGSKRSSKIKGFTETIMDIQDNQSQAMIQKIIQLKDSTGNDLLNRYSIPYLITLLDKNKIQSIDRVYQIKSDGFNLLEFIRFFLNAIEHSEKQTLYLTMGLVDLFKAVSQANSFTEKVKFTHLTDFICKSILTEQVSNSCGSVSNKIEMKLLPEQKLIKPRYQLKQYIMNPPTIYGNNEEIPYKISQSNAKIDKNKHQSVVTNCYFSKTYQKIFTLDALSDSIAIYDTNCKLLRKLRPATSKIKKDIIVLSFAYSQREQRLGAVLKDFTLSFWDFSDNFQFQKVISTASECYEYQTNIWYLQYFQSWITSDKNGGVIYIWSIEKQISQRKIICKYKGKINDVSQIPCLNVLAIAQECRNDSLINNKSNSSVVNGNSYNPSHTTTNKHSNLGNLAGPSSNSEEPKIILYNYLKGEVITEISSLIDMRIPHTLQYSQTYQVLLSAGFQKKINIFEINHRFLDTNLKGELLGHENLITNFTLIKNTPMVVSSDDKGKVKIWDIRNFKCIQTLDFHDRTIITRVLDMLAIGKLGVLGSRINFLEYDQKVQIIKKFQLKEKNVPLQLNFVYEKNSLFILTKRDIRLYNMEKGVTDKIFCDFHHNKNKKDQQIVIFKYYELMKKLLVCNEKGEIKLCSWDSSISGGNASGQHDANTLGGYNSSMKEEKLQGFPNGGIVTHIEYDQDNRLFLVAGQNGTINIQKLTTSGGSSTNFQEESQTTFYRKNTGKYSKSTNQTQDGNCEQWTTIRQMKGNFHDKDITTLALSVYHGMIAIGGSNTNSVYIWDYQYAKILFQIKLPGKKTEPTALAFINGKGLLLIAASNGNVYIFKIRRPANTQPSKVIGQQSSNSNDSIQQTNQQNIGESIKLLAVYETQQQHRVNQLCKTNKSTNSHKTNADQIQQNMAEEYKDFDQVNEILVDVSLTLKKSKKNIKQNANNLFQSKKHKTGLINGVPQNQHQSLAKVYLSFGSGKVTILDLSKILQQIDMIPHRKTAPTYNAQRQLKQQFSIQIQKDKCVRYQIQNDYSQRQNLLTDQIYDRTIIMHNGPINSMRILEFDQHYLATCGQDQRIKIWDYDGNLLGDCNVNLPLPYLWDFVIQEKNKIRDKIMFSLKIIQSIFKKYGSDISTSESKILKLQTFFKELKGQNKKSEYQNFHITEPYLAEIQSNQTQFDSRHKKYLFQQQFTKKDMHFEQIKKSNFNEVAGPCLRQLDFKKKIQTMQKEWQITKVKQEEQKNVLLSKIQQRAQKNDQKQQIIFFLQDKNLSKKRSQRLAQQLPGVKNIVDKLKKIENKMQIQTQTLAYGHNLHTMANLHTSKQTIANGSQSSNRKQTINSRNSFNKNDHKSLLSVNNQNDKLSSRTENKEKYLFKYSADAFRTQNIRNRNILKIKQKQVEINKFQKYYNKKYNQDLFEQQEGFKAGYQEPRQNGFFKVKDPNTTPIAKKQQRKGLLSSQCYNRSASQNSLHIKNDKQRKFQRVKRQYSFQNILKDMNDRVLLSRQSKKLDYCQQNFDTTKRDDKGFLKQNINYFKGISTEMPSARSTFKGSRQKNQRNTMARTLYG